MENKFKVFFEELMEQEKVEELTVAKVLDTLNKTDFDKETKAYIASKTKEHTACESAKKKNEEGFDEDDMKVLTISPYCGDYTLECEWCNTVVVDLETLLEDEE